MVWGLRTCRGEGRATENGTHSEEHMQHQCRTRTPMWATPEWGKRLFRERCEVLSEGKRRGT